MRDRTDSVQLKHLCTLADAAGRLGRPVATLRRWAERRDSTRFPLPVYDDGHKTHIYDFNEIYVWERTWTSTRGTYYPNA